MYFASGYKNFRSYNTTAGFFRLRIRKAWFFPIKWSKVTKLTKYLQNTIYFLLIFIDISKQNHKKSLLNRHIIWTLEELNKQLNSPNNQKNNLNRQSDGINDQADCLGNQTNDLNNHSESKMGWKSCDVKKMWPTVKPGLYLNLNRMRMWHAKAMRMWHAKAMRSFNVDVLLRRGKNIQLCDEHLANSRMLYHA